MAVGDVERHRNKCEQKNYKEYKDLAPSSDIENGEEYIEALNWALANPKIKILH